MSRTEPSSRWLASIAITAISISCSFASLRERPSAPPQQPGSASIGTGSTSPVGARVPLADVADSLFWRILHAGEYDSIPRAMFLLKAAYLQNPSDVRITAHIGFLHAWASAERVRLTNVPPTITDHVILARTYFSRAAALDPSDARVHGFLAAFEMSDANLRRDTVDFAAGLVRGRASIGAWPEFNWFTVGYTLSGRDHTSPLFREALDMQWKTVDACSRTTIDRANPTAAEVFRAEPTERDPLHRRACWNSWIAPHNVEGFFLNMGDMLVKSGDWRTGVKVYELARQVASYPRWAYRDVLEARITTAEQNVTAFRRTESNEHSGPRIMLGSRFACSACHQR